MKSLYSVPSGKDRLDRNIEQMKTIKMVRRKELNHLSAVDIEVQIEGKKVEELKDLILT